MRLLRSVAILVAGTGLSAAGAAGAAAQGSISGTITDQNGTPLQYAFARVAGTDHHVVTLTGSNGKFVSEPLDPGNYALQLSAQPAANLAAQYYPASPTLAGAQLIAVGDAPVTGINVVLAPAATISGTIRDTTGRPLSGASVIPYVGADRAGFPNTETASTAADGTYTVKSLPAATYTLNVSDGTGYTASARPDPVTVVAGQNVTGIDHALVSLAPVITQPAPAPASTSTPLPQLPTGVTDSFSISISPTFDTPAKKVTLASDGSFVVKVHCAANRRCVAPLRLVAGKYVAPPKAKKGSKSKPKKAKAQPSIGIGDVDTKVVDSTATVRLNAAGKKLLRAAKHGLKVTFVAQPGWSETPTTKFSLTLFAAPKKK